MIYPAQGTNQIGKYGFLEAPQTCPREMNAADESVLGTPAERVGHHSHPFTHPKYQHSGSRAVSLTENVLCNYAFISPKPLNRRLFTVQTPLQLGLLIGLQKVRAFCDSMKQGGLDARESIRAVSLRAARGCPEQATLPLTTLWLTDSKTNSSQVARAEKNRR